MMKKLLLLLIPLMLVFFVGCEEDPTIEEILAGTWKVTNMGDYENSDCTGALDNSEWVAGQAFGVTMTFVFSEGGTVTMTTAFPDGSESESSTWTADDDEICIDGDCIGYTLSNNDETLTIKDSYPDECYDDDYETVDMNETACDAAGYYWEEGGCALFTMTKQ